MPARQAPPAPCGRRNVTRSGTNLHHRITSASPRRKRGKAEETLAKPLTRTWHKRRGGEGSGDWEPRSADDTERTRQAHGAEGTPSSPGVARGSVVSMVTLRQEPVPGFESRAAFTGERTPVLHEDGEGHAGPRPQPVARERSSAQGRAGALRSLLQLFCTFRTFSKENF